MKKCIKMEKFYRNLRLSKPKLIQPCTKYLPTHLWRELLRYLKECLKFKVEKRQRQD
jgi:hypothetical protein